MTEVLAWRAPQGVPTAKVRVEGDKTADWGNGRRTMNVAVLGIPETNVTGMSLQGIAKDGASGDRGHRQAGTSLKGIMDMALSSGEPYETWHVSCVSIASLSTDSAVTTPPPLAVYSVHVCHWGSTTADEDSERSARGNGGRGVYILRNASHAMLKAEHEKSRRKRGGDERASRHVGSRVREQRQRDIP